MKTSRPFILYSCFFLFALLILQGCCTSQLHFSGKVVDSKGKAIPEASVQVGDGKVKKTGKDGEFKICAKRSDRYVLNIAKLNFGFVSKVYPDTASRIIITMAKTTTVTVDPTQEIVVQDVNPDMTIPVSAQPSSPASPLDTIPFVYDTKGRLISFSMPAQLRETYKAVAQVQPPRRGASIRIPAQSLVVDGTDTQPQGDVEVSINTIDLYSQDGMPGNNSVDLGENRQGFMVSYGAANIEAFFNDKPLQLGGKKTATLTIPVDTLSIISKDSLPDQIPFLTYNKKTGLWLQEGTAKLNATRDAYSKEVSHFSTFNLDMVWANVSCIRMNNESTLPGTKELEITVPTKTKKITLGASDCAAPDNNLHAIINLNQDTPVGIKLIVGGGTNVKSTYVIYSGGIAYGSADLQDCPYTNCAGTLPIRDSECWMSTSTAGTMTSPVLAVERDGTTDNFHLSWIYINKLGTAPNTVNNPAITYRIEFAVPSGTDTDLDNLNWECVDFDGDPADAGNIYDITAPAGNNWKFDSTVFIQQAGPPPTSLPTTATSTVFFRVKYKCASAADCPTTFTKGILTHINDISAQLSSAWTVGGCNESTSATNCD